VSAGRLAPRAWSPAQPPADWAWVSHAWNLGTPVPMLSFRLPSLYVVDSATWEVAATGDVTMTWEVAATCDVTMTLEVASTCWVATGGLLVGLGLPMSLRHLRWKAHAPINGFFQG
jgi:hypothetical protein